MILIKQGILTWSWSSLQQMLNFSSSRPLKELIICIIIFNFQFTIWCIYRLVWYCKHTVRDNFTFCCWEQLCRPVQDSYEDVVYNLMLEGTNFMAYCCRPIVKWQSTALSLCCSFVFSSLLSQSVSWAFNLHWNSFHLWTNIWWNCWTVHKTEY